jgi:hypothetical protein
MKGIGVLLKKVGVLASRMAANKLHGLVSPFSGLLTPKYELVMD